MDGQEPELVEIFRSAHTLMSELSGAHVAIHQSNNFSETREDRVPLSTVMNGVFRQNPE